MLENNAAEKTSKNYDSSKIAYTLVNIHANKLVKFQAKYTKYVKFNAKVNFLSICDENWFI